MFASFRRFFARPQDGTRAPARLFWVALGVRLLYVALAHTWRVRPFDNHFAFGFEAGRIAQALVTGHGYADPFSNPVLLHTGPTAWLPPLYPLLMAGVFRIFGLYTAASAWVLLVINCVASACTAMAVWELGFRFAAPGADSSGGRATGGANALSVARWSGWLWALYPAAMQYAVKWFWEMSLTTAFFAWVLVLAMRMRAEPLRNVTRRWAAFGVLWGLIALSNSTLLVFLPVCGVWILLGNRMPRALVSAAVAGIVFLAMLAPWMLRNERVFQAFIPMRGNFGAELALGNGPGATGFLMEYNHPYQAPNQLRQYATLGEVGYVRLRGDFAKRTIAADPGLFVRNTLKRMDFFWFSVPHDEQKHEAGEWIRVEDFALISVAGLLGLLLALRRRMPAAGLWAWAILLLPLPYYAVTSHARFRHPLEPILCVLAVYLFQSASPGRPGGRFRAQPLRRRLAHERPNGYS